MRKSFILSCLIASLSLVNSQLSIAQNDTTLTRTVTVERDFQPVIQNAGKINQRPAIITHELQLNPVIYSTYSTPLSVGYNVSLLPAAETRFTPQAPLQGILDGAVGHRNTHLRFDYQIHHKKKMSLHLFANHDAYWGKDALSQSQLGMLVTRHFSGADLYFGIEGSNDAYTYPPISRGWWTLWNAAAKIGLRSTNQSPIQYRIQTGYSIFTATDETFEHSVQSHLDVWWMNQQHSAGVKAYVQNNFYSTTLNGLILPSRHNIRIEPFYEYKGDHIRLHAGVNMDLNVGTGELLSTVKNLSFAPSPNVHFEWRMMDDIFHVYANATGQYGLGSWEEYMGYNRYLTPLRGLTLNTPRAYTPVDAQFGFKLRPAKTLLIDIYGGYAYYINACNMRAELNNNSIASYNLWFSDEDIQRWKVGANIHYHYRDIVELNLNGNYYFYPTTTPIFDRPDWDAFARVDVHIDSKWSIYSENYFAGSRLVLISTGSDQSLSKRLSPTISLNLGGQYAINRWLIAYLQLNNYLNRKNDIFFGYKEQGIHFLLGVKWKF